MIYHVIDKRHLELDDLAQGNKLTLIKIISHGFEQKSASLESAKRQSMTSSSFLWVNSQQGTPGWLSLIENHDEE